jgi:hypothetical protein
VFFALGQVAGMIAPLIYGALIGNGSNRTGLTIGYLARMVPVLATWYICTKNQSFSENGCTK